MAIAYAESTGEVELPADLPTYSGPRQFLLEALEDRLDRHAAPELSAMVRKPLAVAAGGLAHVGGDNYAHLDDPGLQIIRRWVALEQSGEPRKLTAFEARYRDEILPILGRRSCLAGACHGPLAANFFRQEPGFRGTFSDLLVQRNFSVFKGFVGLDAATPEQTRFIAKVLPLRGGGAPHRGSNDLFEGPASPELAALRDFVGDYLLAQRGEEQPPAGLVYVARPPGQRDYFDVGAWLPGAELWLLAPLSPQGARTQLSLGLHSGPADLRTPEVSPDGRRVLFAMRRSVEDCLNIYLLELATSALTQLTADSGCAEASFGPSHANPANLSPRFAPDGRVFFISTRGGRLADKGNYPDTNLWVMNADGGGARAVSRSYGHELDPALNHKGEIALTSLRDIGLDPHAAIYTVPTLWGGDYHPHFGNQSRYPVFAQHAELTDERELVSLQPLGGGFQAGALALIDRNVGVNLEDGAAQVGAAIPGFMPSMVVLADEGAARGERGFLWRNPVPLHDGRFVVSRSSSAAAPSEGVDFGLWLGRLGASERTRTASIAELTVLVDEPGVWEVEPALVGQRHLPKPKPSYLRSDMPPGTATVKIYDVLTIESIMEDSRPTGRADKIDAAIAGLRFVFGLPPSPADMARPPPAAVRNGDPASTRVSNGIHGRRYALGPRMLEEDRSLYVRIPADQPYFFQPVGADGLATGFHHDRWFFANEGEPFASGVTNPSFDRLCAGCHGSFSGRPGEALAGIDAITSASQTRATHDERGYVAPPFDLTGALERRSVSYARELGPLLERRCATAGCHDQGKAGGLDLSLGTAYGGPWSQSYESLMALGTGSGGSEAGAFQKEYVDERGARARRSHLMEKVLGRELDAARVLAGTECRAAAVLDDREKARLGLWIDLGATFLGADDP